MINSTYSAGPLGSTIDFIALIIFSIQVHSTANQIPFFSQLAGESPFKAFIFLFAVLYHIFKTANYLINVIGLSNLKGSKGIQEITGFYFYADFILFGLCRIKHFAFVRITSAKRYHGTGTEAFSMVGIYSYIVRYLIAYCKGRADSIRILMRIIFHNFLYLMTMQA